MTTRSHCSTKSLLNKDSAQQRLSLLQTFKHHYAVYYKPYF